MTLHTTLMSRFATTSTLRVMDRLNITVFVFIAFTFLLIHERKDVIGIVQNSQAEQISGRNIREARLGGDNPLQLIFNM